MRDVFLTAQESSFPLWGLSDELLSHEPARGIAGAALGYWALWGTVRDWNNPSRYLGQRMGYLQQVEKEVLCLLTDNCSKAWVGVRWTERASFSLYKVFFWWKFYFLDHGTCWASQLLEEHSTLVHPLHRHHLTPANPAGFRPPAHTAEHLWNVGVPVAGSFTEKSSQWFLVFSLRGEDWS